MSTTNFRRLRNYVHESWMFSCFSVILHKFSRGVWTFALHIFHKVSLYFPNVFLCETQKYLFVRRQSDVFVENPRQM